ncbi:MAG: hypothetical protein DIZ80_08060 [endosymbiont of Galathealinum brachiosum]|uniref:diguanylate cyclase n=1 Tax=endosymbiont of Galathealinum brachiosum TaxID=2200906 RepID=A0A370DGN3_9GAMM|nr:MAG: hypothetical protein DIZ80_08060 [endosymbiont of Galathealinum brachiosum]
MNDNTSCQLTDRQLENIISELEIADINHLEWLKCVHSSIICNHEFEKDAISDDSHKLCRFGHWYYNDAPELLQSRPDFLAIDELHKVMHDAARQLAELHNNKASISKTEYEEFILKQRAFSKKLLRLRDSLRDNLLSFDPLTGLMTRGPFTHIISTELARVERANSSSCLAMIDIDYFKKINDTYGHLTGDRVLSSISQFLLHHIRSYDSICRYGGEEFLVCLPMTNSIQALEVMQRICFELEEHQIEHDDDISLKTTISIGIAEFKAGENYESCLKRADDMLYKAKHEGRNRVCV